MPAKSPPQLTSPDPKDPLGYGLKSIPEPLLRFWLIGKYNPYFDAEVRGARLLLGLPIAGFENTKHFVEWVARKRSLHGHSEPFPFSLNIDGLTFEGREDLMWLHYWDISWPIKDYELPGRCCPTDPLFLAAMDLAKRFGIDRAGAEPGFPGVTETVVGYLLVGNWPHPESLAGMHWTEESDYLDPITHERIEEWKEVVIKGLKARGGEGRQLAVWYGWWNLRRNGKSISKIVRETDSATPGSTTIDEGTIRKGVSAVERLMLPV